MSRGAYGSGLNFMNTWNKVEEKSDTHTHTVNKCNPWSVNNVVRKWMNDRPITMSDR